MKKHLLPKLGYIALQGVFLPLILQVDDLGEHGSMMAYWIAFAFYEVLVIGDAWLYWVVFRKER